jgi:hypothetical protein
VKWPEEFRVTSGARLDFISEGQVVTGGTTGAGYSVAAVGLPRDRTYRLWLKSLSIPTPKELTDATIDDSGYVAAGGKPIQLSFGSPAKGEAFEIALMTADKTSGAIGKVIPFPLESRQGHYRLWVEVLSKEKTVFAIYGEGFEPDEETIDVSASEGEVLRCNSKADDSGRLTILNLPSVVGKASGQATYTVIGKYGEVSVSYRWGAQ